MASSPRKPRGTRPHGRLGIDLNAQSPSILPPIHQSASPHRRHHSQKQEDERKRLQKDFTQRLDVNKKLFDLQPLADVVKQVIDEQQHHQTESEDCFMAVKTVAQAITQLGAPFLGQFIEDLIYTIESLARDRLQHEAAVIESRALPHSPHRLAIGASTTSDCEGGASDEAEGEATSSDGEEYEEDTDNHEEEEADQKQTPVASSSVPVIDRRNLPRGTMFRTTLRSRAFPPTRVPPVEFIRTTCVYTPFELCKKPPDLSSMRIQGRDENGSAEWAVVLFPKNKPSLANADELAGFEQWVRTRQKEFDETHHLIDGSSHETLVERLKAQLALKETVCYEFCRFVFDKCPTTARFLHGLFVELVEVTLRTLGNAERDAMIMEQRHKNVQLELTRLHTQLHTVRTSLGTLQETLARRHQQLLHERECIIRKRKTLNQLLCADQVLIRRVMALVQRVQEIADDVTQAQMMPLASPGGNLLLGAQVSEEEMRFPVANELLVWVQTKYNNLEEVNCIAQQHERGVSTEALTEVVNNASETGKDVIVLDLNDIKTASEALKNTLLRLMRMVSGKSPDSAVGWDAQELWDQALFIPPHEDVQDLERDVQRLVRHVEEHVISRRWAQCTVARRNAAVQTEIQACVPKKRTLEMPVSRSRPQELVEDRIAQWHWRLKQRRRLRNADSSATGGIAADLASQDDLLRTLVPDELRRYLPSALPPDYTPHQLALHDVHAVISYLFNHMWLLVQEDLQQHPPHSRVSFLPMSAFSSVLPLAGVHTYLYRIYLQHFRIPAVVTCRLLDLLVSTSHLDTQSGKVLLFARLLGLPGVAPLPSDGFWFLLKTIHVLQRACGSAGNYFLLDGSGNNEFVSQASASEALGLLFARASNDVVKRLRLKLTGLASVYGAVWIPAYSIVTFIVDEWDTMQDALRHRVEQTLLLTRLATSENTTSLPTLATFLDGLTALELRVDRLDAISAYRELLQDSKTDASRFQLLWVHRVIHAVNRTQQRSLTSRGLSGMPGVHLGAVPDAFTIANDRLSIKFLTAGWEAIKPESIRRLSVIFQDVGLQVRLIQQMDQVVQSTDDPANVSAAAASAWRSLQELLQIAFESRVVF